MLIMACCYMQSVWTGPLFPLHHHHYQSTTPHMYIYIYIVVFQKGVDNPEGDTHTHKQWEREKGRTCVPQSTPLQYSEYADKHTDSHSLTNIQI